MEAKKLKEILDKHLKWRRNEDGGERANLAGADLSRANLYGADLTGAYLYRAYLYGADLTGADLTGANLTGAYLYGAYLSGADLSGADLTGADLTGADLTGANLTGAYLYRAYLSGADLTGANIELKLVNKFFPICCPEYGSFIAWKKAGDKKHIVKLEVAEAAKRSSAYGRKCRCSEAKVLAIELLDGSETDATEVKSGHDSSFIYRLGETVKVDDFDEDRRNECAPGIHFFITRQEAVDY